MWNAGVASVETSRPSDDAKNAELLLIFGLLQARYGQFPGKEYGQEVIVTNHAENVLETIDIKRHFGGLSAVDGVLLQCREDRYAG